MSIQTIYAKLVQAGMTPESACGMMGNMQAESGMISTNVQDRMGYEDEDYTAAVDAGAIDFVSDQRGYGLCQWTYPGRKLNLLNFARSRGVSIGDEDMQVDFCVMELRTEYAKLWQWLCTNKGVAPAAERICREYERPAANNYGPRNAAANQFYMTLGGMDVGPVPTEAPSAANVPESGTGSESEFWPPRVLAYGMAGPDVVALQGLLIAHGFPAGITGSFDNATAAQLRAFQSAHGLKVDAIAGDKSWTALCRR